MGMGLGGEGCTGGIEREWSVVSQERNKWWKEDGVDVEKVGRNGGV